VRLSAILAIAALVLSPVPALARAKVQSPEATASAPEIYPPGQLGDAVKPVAYRLDLTVDPAQPRFSGRVEIDVVLAAPASEIVLHGRELAVREVTAKTGGRVVTGQWRQIDPTGVAAVRLAEPLPAGPATLAFAYDAAFNDGPSGLFRVQVGGDWYAWSQFESIDARSAFPGFDQPSFKTPFSVTLRTPPGLMAVGNAPQASMTSESGLDVHRFVPTLPLPTYLVALMAGPFVTVEGQVPPTPQRAKPLPLRIVSTRQNAARLDFALEGSKQIVTLLEDYFADGFPYPKLDQVTAPIMPGAMENAGADLYRDSILVMDRDAPVAQQRTFGMVVGHELAHQWFGDLVTPAWWNDIWLNESFANWMGYHVGNQWRPDLNIGSGALKEGFAAMSTDALTVGRPIRQPIARNDQIDSAFDSITYGKGGHVVAMIAAYLGDERFRDGVRRYMAAHRYGVATSSDFFAALAEAAGDPRIVPAMQGFIDQQGVPLLTFVRSGEGYRVTQERYVPLGSTPPPASWGVPVCARRGAERKCLLLTEHSALLDIGGTGAIVPNAGGAGYYRFELAEADWTALIAQARQLSPGEALAAADSLAASIRAGRARVIQLGALARSLAGHPDSYASRAAIDALAELARSDLVDVAGRRQWAAFRGKLFAPLLSRTGFDPRVGTLPGDDPEKTQRRVQLVDALVGTRKGKGLRNQLFNAATAYLAGDRTALDPVWFDEAFAIYIDRTGEAGARALMSSALASEDPVFRPKAMNAVASSGLKAVARWLLYDFDDARARPVERADFVGNIMLTRPTRDIGYDWMRQNLDRLIADTGGIFLARQLPGFLTGFCSTEKADELAAIFRSRFAGTAGATEMERVIERVRDCGVLARERGAEISADFADLK